jgi:multiple antibiotic resistance protein
MQETVDPTTVLGLGGVFTLFFVTLGPLKIFGPFAQLTRDADETSVRKIAVLAFVLAVFAVVAGGFGGRALLQNWNISIPAMLLTSGIIFFLVGLNLVLEQYRPAHPLPPPLPTAPMAAAMRLTFPLVVTPYGIAALIVLLANSGDGTRTASILAVLNGVMALNLLAMLFARRIMGSGVTVIVLQVLGAVLGVLQVALAVEMILRGLHGLGVLPG